MPPQREVDYRNRQVATAMWRVRPSRSVLLAALACWHVGAGAAVPAWLPLTWHVDSFAGGPPERLALFLPARIDDAPCLVQLDTGANGEWMWTGHDARVGGAAKRFVTVELAGIRKQVPADAANLRYVTPEVCAQRAVATVGNAFFEHGTLTLDLGKARFAFTPGPTLASNPAAHPLFYARWTATGGHPLVEVQVAHAPPGYALLDTGATRFGLAATDAGGWAALTDGAPLAAGNGVRQFSLNSWGKAVQCFETTVAKRLSLAGAVLDQARASYCVDQGFRSPVKLVGVLGLLPLRERVITLDYPSRRWMLTGN